MKLGLFWPPDVDPQPGPNGEGPRPYLFVWDQTLVSWQTPLTGWYSREFLESGIRSVECSDCPTAQCGGGHEVPRVYHQPPRIGPTVEAGPTGCCRRGVA